MTHEAADDELRFEDEDAGAAPAAGGEAWRILIVDDEPDVHDVTRLAVRNLSFGGKGLTFVSAYSAAEATKLLSEDRGFALALVDVIMEEDDAGLKLVRFVRETLRDRRLRIVLRTGQPGLHQEEEVMVGYDINDYKTKTELTRAKLASTVISALRSVSQIDEIVALHEQQVQASKMSTVGEFSLGIFHDLATPLTVAMNTAEEIKEAITPGDAAALKRVERLERACGKMNHLAKRLREFAWFGDAPPATVALRALCQRAVEMCSMKVALHGVTVVYDMPEDLALVGHEAQLEQVMINLVSNACDAMSEAPARRLTLAGRIEGGEIALYVADSGPGIPPEIQAKIFQTFFTTKPKGKGTGLGLSICRTILEGHGGRLELGTLPGAPAVQSGAVFRIVLPPRPPETPKGKS